MQNQITNLEIQNFKSIKQLNLNCKRINIFIGKPNVGKSNILEALSLLSAPYVVASNSNKYLANFIRYEYFNNLFFDQDLQDKVSISTNIGSCSLRYSYDKNAYLLVLAGATYVLSDIENFFELKNQVFDSFPDDSIVTHSQSIKPCSNEIREDGIFALTDVNSLRGSFKADDISDSRFSYSPVKKYDFVRIEKHENRFPTFLLPPYGANLFKILQVNKSFYKQITPLFEEYGLELVLRIRENKFEIQKNLDGIVYSYPYSTIADTLQRIIFYLTAIESNKDSVLLFEEPEAHAFPPYTRMLADRIVRSEENQFFITTHSPYLLHTIIENTPFEELGVFVTYFEDYQTKVKALSHEKIRDVLDDSIDVFFNLDRLLADEE